MAINDPTSASKTAGSEPFERLESDKEKIHKSMNDQRCIRMVRDFMTRSAKYREPHLELAKRSRELYENWRVRSRSLIQRANLQLPFGFTIIETQLPQLVDIFFRNGETISFKGQDYEDAEFENSITDFHQHQLSEMDFESRTAGFIKSMLLDGTAFAKIPYQFEEIKTLRRETQIDPVTGERIMRKREVSEITLDGPGFELIPIYDFYPDWSVRVPGEISKMRGCVHRWFNTFTALKTDRAKYKNLSEVTLSVESKGSMAWSPPYYTSDNYKQDFENLQDNPDPGMKDRGKIEVWEYWGLWDEQGDGNFEEYIITVANGDVILKKEPNFYDYKFKPFVACPNYLREQEFYGIPELMPVRSLVKEANSIRNARLDNINLSVNPMWLVDRASGVNHKSLYSRPNGIVWTNDINGIKPLGLQDPSIGSAQEMQTIQQDIQNASALVNAAPAASSLGKQFGRSATGVNFISSFSTSRIGLKARVLSDLYFKRIAWLMLMTNRQFVTEDKWVRVSDPNSPNPFVTLPPDAFFRKFDFSAETNLQNGGPEAQLGKMQAAAQIIQAIEQSQPGTAKMDVLLEQLLRPLLGRQVKRFVRSDQERQEIQNQQLASEQAINAEIGQNAPQPNAESAGQTLPGILAQQSLGI